MSAPSLRISGLVQGWLQLQPWPLWRLGNALSTLRFWIWRAVGTL